MARIKKINGVPVQHFDTGGDVANFGKGALGGAASGAAIGTLFGPGPGTAIGAGIGGLVGGFGSLFQGNPSLLGGDSSKQAAMPNITNPVNGAQITDAYGNVVANQQQMHDYVAQLQGQNGVQNQSNVYNQYGQIAAGQGPNLAQAMLNQQTGTNVANQAALMASQRGAGANPALLARQAAQQGAAIQQNAVGQGATLQAQQQLAALNAQAGIAGQQVGQLGSTLAQQQNASLQGQQNLLGAQGAYNQSIVGGQNSVNSANSALNVQQQQAANGALAGGLQAAGTIAGIYGKGNTNTDTPSKTTAEGIPTTDDWAKFTGAQKYAGGEIGALPPHLQHVATLYGHNFNQGGMALMRTGGTVPGQPQYPGDNPKNDVVPAMLSKGEIVLPNSVTQSENPADAAAQFVAQLKNKKSGDPKADFQEALKRAVAERKHK
jgi:hypothetical protein